MQAPQSAAAPRSLALDNLRALAMLAGVLFHAALAHSPLLHPVFPTADASQASGMDLWLWPMHLVRMPLFFVIAGYFAAQSLARRGMAGLMRERARRLLLPLLLLAPLFYGVMGALIGWAAQSVERPSPLLRWLRQALENPGAAPSLPPSTGHLWFLYYLLLLAVLLWAARLLLPLALKSWLRQLAPLAWVLGLPLLLTPAFALTSAPHPAPEGLLPQFWALTTFGAYFACGFLLGPRLAELTAWRWLAPLLGAGSLACAAFVLQLDGLRAQAGWPLGLASATASVWLTLALLGLAQRLLNASTPLLRYLAGASYWVYLVHLPLLFAWQFALMDSPWPWFLKLPLATLVTLGLSLGSYELLVRRSPIGPWLLGQRPAAARPLQADAAKAG